MKTRTITGMIAALTGVAALTWLWRRYRTIDAGSLPVEAVLAREAHQEVHHGRQG